MMTEKNPNQTWSNLTAFRRDLLQAVAQHDGDPYGLEVKSTVEEWYGSEILNGRLYPNLDALAERGLVSKGTIDDRTNSYALTEWGERVLEAGSDRLAEVTA